MGAAWKPIVVEQGSNFQLVVSVVGGPVSLAGYTGRMQIRDLKPSSVVLFDTTSIVVDSVNRQAVLTIPYTATTGFTWDHARYDILLTAADTSAAYRIVEGTVTIDKAVTRETA